MDRWFFIHIMKTAGTSFRTMLEQTPDLPIYPTRAELTQHPRRWYPTAPELLGRIERGEVEPLDPAVRLRAFFRQPRRGVAQ